MSGVKVLGVGAKALGTFVIAIMVASLGRMAPIGLLLTKGAPDPGRIRIRPDPMYLDPVWIRIWLHLR